MHDAVIVSAVRTPTGKFLGGLKSLTAPQLGALAVREAHGVARLQVPNDLDHASQLDLGVVGRAVLHHEVQVVHQDELVAGGKGG